VSVNASAGFSVVTYSGNSVSGATVGHGLGVTPQLVILKSRTEAYNWRVYSPYITAGYTLYLNTTDGQSVDANYVSSASSSTFTCTGTDAVNKTGNTYVAYCWTPIAGYSAFGSYTGNGSTDGPFVYTGFKPKFVLLKCTSAAGQSWRILDSTRNPYNAVNLSLYPNLSDAEDSSFSACNFTANGFKITSTTSGTNTSGDTYIYAAFASNPFKNSLAF
jgi:hypothetical protein